MVLLVQSSLVFTTMQIVARKAGRITHFDRVVCLRRGNRRHSKYRLVLVISFQALFGIGRFVLRITVGRHGRGAKYPQNSAEAKFVDSIHLPYSGNVVPRGGR